MWCRFARHPLLPAEEDGTEEARMLTGEEGGDGMRGYRDLKIGALIGSPDTGSVLKHNL